MNRDQTKRLGDDRKKIDEKPSQGSSDIIESSSSTISKFYNGEPYDKEDIIKCGESLLIAEKHPPKQLVVIDKMDDFNDSTVDSTKPFFVIYAKQENRWVLICVVKEATKKTVMFKDPSGEVPEEKVKEKFPDAEFIVHNQKDQESDDVKSYGPLTLRNLKIVLNFLNQGKNFQEFNNLKFTQTSNFHMEKSTKVSTLTKELATNEKFKIALREFINKLPLDLVGNIDEYHKVMEEELEKDQEHIDFERIKAVRKKMLSTDSLTKFKEDNNLDENINVSEYQLKIEKDYPEEMKQLKDIFIVLDNMKVDAKLFQTLENISNVLGIDYKKMKSFYESKAKKETEPEEEKLSPEDIEKIAKTLPQLKGSSNKDSSTPLKQLLEKIVLGMDQEDSTLNMQSQEEIKKIEKKYYKVKKHYAVWGTKDIRTINSWAKKMKGKLGNTDDDICEALAIMDRALNLLTGDHRLRDTQILAVLIFLHSQNQQGRLCQIQTGEGKTVIVSLLAVLKVLQGQTVDVITSNSVLAEDGVEESRKFYTTFGLTVSTNNPGPSESKIGYTADVLYGTISNFQFDFLKDTFEGYNIRRNRAFGQVILDEVDSMLVDNGGHIAKLASPFPGMECLRYIYIKIWEELHKAEESFKKECNEDMEDILKNCSREEIEQKYEEFIQKTINEERNIIKDKIKASNPTNIPLVPDHLKEYVKEKLDTWIKNALHAKYNCHEHQQYRLTVDDSGEKIVTPVDYLNTGITMKNTIWSNGLHQFVQLKHNLYLTFESLTSSFISNIGYIKQYEDKNIFGLTGTLGSRAEQELLSHIYNVDYAKIPTYKEKKFTEVDGIIVEDDSWSVDVALEALTKVDEKRAVLLICETEQDLMMVKKNLEVLKNNDDFRIRTFANEDNATETDEKVKIGDIILATNIAGRGTNFKTEKTLEESGGLHVCVGFLPCNLRVEGQAFGRTSRQGNNGTAQLIIRQSEVDELGIDNDKPTFKEIKQERDNLERQRLKDINDNLVKELNFKDELFSYFSKLHRNLKQIRNTEEFWYILQDLKEFWAFWLEKKKFTAKDITKTPQEEFDSFCREAEPILKENKIMHNPYYCISLGNYYIDSEKRAEAEKILNQAIKMESKDNNLLAGAHMKLFELAIYSGDQIRERFKKAVGKLFFFDIEKNEEYRKQAKFHLNMAQEVITKEITYFDNHFNDQNKDFVDIINEEKSPFLKHLNSRYISLKVCRENIKTLLKNIDEYKGGVDFEGKVPTTLDNFGEFMDKETLKELSGCEMSELQSVGIDTLYSLREVYDASETVIHGAQIQIGSGLVALGAGLIFPPIFPFMSSIAGTFISEGIIDIVMEIISNGISDFDKKDYIKGKFQSYATSLLTLGIGAATQSVTILNKAIKFCQKLSSFLRKSQHLTTLCEKLASAIDKIEKVLNKMLVVAEFKKLTDVEKLEKLKNFQNTNPEYFEKLGGIDKLTELEHLKNSGQMAKMSRIELVQDFAIDVLKNTSKELGKSIFKEKVLEPYMRKAFDKAFENIKNSIRKSIKDDKVLIEKLRTTPPEHIQEVLDEFTKEDKILAKAENIAVKIVGTHNKVVADVLDLAYSIGKNYVEFNHYVKDSVSYLKEHLPGGNWDNDTDDVIEEIVTKLSDAVYDLCCDMVENIYDKSKKGAKWGFDKMNEKNKKDESKPILDSPDDETTVLVDENYKIVGLAQDASLQEVKNNYRKVTLHFHFNEDLNDTKTKNNFQRICDAYKKILETVKS